MWIIAKNKRVVFLWNTLYKTRPFSPHTQQSGLAQSITGVTQYAQETGTRSLHQIERNSIRCKLLVSDCWACVTPLIKVFKDTTAGHTWHEEPAGGRLDRPSCPSYNERVRSAVNQSINQSPTGFSSNTYTTAKWTIFLAVLKHSETDA